MALIDPAPPRAPVAPEDEMARGDVAIPAPLDPQLLAAIQMIWAAPDRAPDRAPGTAELDENGVVILRDAEGNFEAACSEEVWVALRAAPAPAPSAAVVSFTALFGLEDLPVPRRRDDAGQLARQRHSDANEVFATANGPVVAGD